MYTEDQIKAVFRTRFHGIGELHFPEIKEGDHESIIAYSESVTEREWAGFLGCLKEASIRPIPDPTTNDLVGGA